MKRRYILVVPFMVFCGSIHAQSNGNHALVNIENEYTPEIIKVNKKGNTPTVEEDIEVSPLKLRFTDKVQPFKGFTSERDTKEAFPKQDEQYPGYVRLGYGFTNDIDAKAAYTLKTSKEGKMEILAGFDGFKTGVEGEENDWDQRMFRSMLGASYTHRFNSLEMGVNADFSNSVFNYQSTDGYNPGLTDKQNSRTYRLGTTGVSRLDGPFAYSYDAGITYNRRSYSSGSDEGTGELGFNIDSRISYQVGESLKELGVDLGFNGFIYNSRLRDADNGFSNFASFDVNPYLLFDFDIWRIKVGTKMNFVTANGPRFAIAPDIKVEGNISENAGLYGEITGGRSVNSLAENDRITPYWGFDYATSRQLAPTYRVVDIKAGAHITAEPFSFGIYAGYAYTKDDLLQSIGSSMNNAMYTFRLIYTDLEQQNTHNIFVGGRAGCDVGGWLNLSAEARYDKWNGDNKGLLMMKPMITADINAEFRIVEKFTFRAGYNFTRYTKGNDSRRFNNKNDLYARANYEIFDWLGAYIQGSNLLNSDFYEYAGYRTRGIRGSLGVTVNF